MQNQLFKTLHPFGCSLELTLVYFVCSPRLKKKICQDHACNSSKEKLTSQKIRGLRKRETRYLGQVFKRGGASDTCPSVWRDLAGSLNFGEIRKNFPL